MRGQIKISIDHPIIDILNVFTSPIVVDSSSQLLQDFYSTWKLPVISKQDISHVIDSLRTNTLQSDPLSFLAPKFIFSSTQLSTFLNFFANDIPYLDQTYPVVLANGLGFMLNMPNISYYPQVLNSLFALSRSSAKSKADYLFLFILERVVKSQNTLTPEMIDLIIPHLNCKGDLDAISFTVNCQFMERLFSLNMISYATQV